MSVASSGVGQIEPRYMPWSGTHGFLNFFQGAHCIGPQYPIGVMGVTCTLVTLLMILLCLLCVVLWNSVKSVEGGSGCDKKSDKAHKGYDRDHNEKCDTKQKVVHVYDSRDYKNWSRHPFHPRHWLQRGDVNTIVRKEEAAGGFPCTRGLTRVMNPGVPHHCAYMCVLKALQPEKRWILSTYMTCGGG